MSPSSSITTARVHLGHYAVGNHGEHLICVDSAVVLEEEEEEGKDNEQDKRAEKEVEDDEQGNRAEEEGEDDEQGKRTEGLIHVTKQRYTKEIKIL